MPGLRQAGRPGHAAILFPALPRRRPASLAVEFLRHPRPRRSGRRRRIGQLSRQFADAAKRGRVRRSRRRSRVDTAARPDYKPALPAPAPGNAQVAQLVEHATENRSVGGSIPPLGTMLRLRLRMAQPHCRLRSVPGIARRAMTGLEFFFNLSSGAEKCEWRR